MNDCIDPINRACHQAEIHRYDLDVAHAKRLCAWDPKNLEIVIARVAARRVAKEVMNFLYDNLGLDTESLRSEMREFLSRIAPD